ncbi:acyl-CoA thioesterase [Mycolicibacterium thermoresistibile]
MTLSWIARLLQFSRDGDTFVVPQPPSGVGDRLFGGLIAAQALAAAGATVEEAKHPQSLHLYFVRGGDYGVDVVLEVERIRDGRSFDTRRVTATQRGATILEMIASFHVPEPAQDWHPVTEPGVEFEAAVPKTPAIAFADCFDIRTRPDDDSAFAIPPFWARSRTDIEDDPLIRACTLTYLSDIGPVPVAGPPGSDIDDPTSFAASLDHAVWFHRPYVPTAWHRYEVRSLNNSDSRGLVVGSLYDAAGTLIASTTQEALWRV